jgi:hypothetical protein
MSILRRALLALALLGAMSHAEMRTAASVSYEAVSAAISAASANDTVLVPAGSAAWMRTLTVTKGIVLKGSGIGSTIITNNTADHSSLIRYRPADYDANDPFRLTGFTFDLASNGAGFVLGISGKKAPFTVQTRIWIDHNRFANDSTGTHQAIWNYGGMYGVVDNNVFDGVVYPTRNATQVGGFPRRAADLSGTLRHLHWPGLRRREVRIGSSTMATNTGGTGCETALATLMREEVDRPCINYSWMTSSSYMSKVSGRDYWSDREGVFFEYLHQCGINLVPQWYFPGEAQRNIERGHTAHEHLPGGMEAITGPEDILRAVDRLPSDSAVETEYNIEAVARSYADALRARIDRTNGETLFIDWFGQADFMGGYKRWGYENYLMAMMDYPEAMRRYYHYTALLGRLFNQAIVLARAKYGIAPFVYSGQDICMGGGPIVAPRVLRDIYFPELKWAMQPLIENGIGVIWHCDGNIMPILSDILDLGVIGLQGFEEEHGVSYDEIVKLKDRAGRPLSVWGCVSVTSTLPHGSVEDVKKSVERSFRLAGKGRGFVLSSTSSVMPEVPHENIDALFQHGRKFGAEFLSR